MLRREAAAYIYTFALPRHHFPQDRPLYLPGAAIPRTKAAPFLGDLPCSGLSSVFSSVFLWPTEVLGARRSFRNIHKKIRGSGSPMEPLSCLCSFPTSLDLLEPGTS